MPISNNWDLIAWTEVMKVWTSELLKFSEDCSSVSWLGGCKIVGNGLPDVAIFFLSS
jgi:hypothetical protein